MMRVSNYLDVVRHWRGASVAEPADAPGLGPGVRKDVGVRVSPLAPAPTLTCTFRSRAQTGTHSADPESPLANGLLTEDLQPSAVKGHFKKRGGVLVLLGRARARTRRGATAEVPRWFQD